MPTDSDKDGKEQGDCIPLCLVGIQRGRVNYSKEAAQQA